MRDVAFVAVTAALLLGAASVKAEERSASARDRANELRERARANARSDNERVRHGKPADASAALLDPGDDGHWAHVGISSLGQHVAIYDPVRDRMIVFGGDDDGTWRYDTWSLSMTNPHPWSKLAPTGPTPPQAVPQTAVYDPVRDRMLMLSAGYGDPATLNDVWALNLSGAPQWTRLATTGPKPDIFGPAVYDPVRDRLIVTDGSGAIWTLSLSGTLQWTQIIAAGTSPGLRVFPAAVYDSTRDRLLLWGGDGDVFLPTDLWALSLSGTPTWTQVPANGAPATGRFATTAIYDPVNDRLVIYGGSDYHNRPEGWTINLSGTPAWTQLDTHDPYPHGRSFHTGVYDTARQRLVIFSGYQFAHGSPDRNDLWALSLNTLKWSTVRGTSPETRSFQSAVYDPDADRMLVFGGYSSDAGYDVTGELWELTLDARPTWNLLSPTGSGPRASHPIAVYDHHKHRLIVFTDTGVWEYTFRKTPGWTRLEPEGTGPVQIHSAVFDARRHRVIALAAPDNAAYELSLSEHPRWRKIDATANEPISGGSVAVYDKKRERLLIWGETQNLVVWSLSLSGHPQWTKITTPGPAPTVRRNYTLVYDKKRDRLVLHAGALPPNYSDDHWTWALSLSGTPQWHGLDSTFDGYVVLEDGHSAIYDPEHDRMIVFGGEYFYNMLDETWALQFGTPAASTTTVAGVTHALQPAYPNPFNPRVTIPFELANDGPVTLSVYDVSGRLVKKLVDEWTARGAHLVTWEGTNQNGEHVASGVYFYRLTAGRQVET
ncbi:MAG TPA: kelch repeat-containing protein, partial [Candidatus Krumholzibacteria bacterium]|nr:kelch repeat-containing protein [Candidatus Krumholzibacteria bacterium]